MDILQIEGSNSYHRDVKTHAVININNTEYEAYMRQRKIIEQAKDDAELSKQTIQNMSKDIESLKQIVQQLLIKDQNVTTTPSK